MRARIAHRGLTWVTWYSIVEDAVTKDDALERYKEGDYEPQDYYISDTEKWDEPEVVSIE